MKRKLYKYFNEKKWAEKFLDGEIFFRSLSYFRDYEDNHIRGDVNEGSYIHAPIEGLIINNITQKKTFVLKDHNFQSSADIENIFVFCLSGCLNDQLKNEFGKYCVEIGNIELFCDKVTKALPANAVIPIIKNKSRIGNWVDYYDTSSADGITWALPDKMALSKRRAYSWQNEFRLAFSDSNAFEVENTKLSLSEKAEVLTKNLLQHRDLDVKVPDLNSFCQFVD